MSAQYRPYRDEEDVPPEERAWVDDMPGGGGRIQIYEKTTQDIHHVVTQRHLILGGCSLAVFFALLGLLIGYFAHTEHAACVRGKSVALFSVYDEDPLVKSKILSLVDKAHFVSSIRLFESENGLSEDSHIEIIKQEWNSQGLDEIFIQDFEAEVGLPPVIPNTLEVLDESGGLLKKYPVETSSSLKPYVAYSASNSVQASVVYVSRLSNGDFHELEKSGVNWTEHIILVRLGTVPLKEQLVAAASLNVKGLLFYMDPYDFDDKDYVDDAIPNLASYHVGHDGRHSDKANKASSPRDEFDEFEGLKDVPIQAISGDMANSILSAMQGHGPKAVLRDRGGFNITYHQGPSKFDVKLTVSNTLAKQKLKNVIGVIRGKVEPDRYVLVGSARDGWSNSSVGGMAVLQELSHVFGKLVGEGWRPRRSIIFISFAAGHLNALGLNTFMERELNILEGRAVAYIDVTNPVLGRTSVFAAASPLMYQSLFNATMQVASANTNAAAKSTVNGADEAEVDGSTYREWLKTFPYKKTVTAAQLHITEADQNAAMWDGPGGGAKTQQAGPPRTLKEFLVSPANTQVNRSHGLFTNYLKAALQESRPTVRGLDYTDDFSAMMTSAGVPVCSLSYVSEDAHLNRRLSHKPAWYRTQYDTLQRITKEFDPDYRRHIAVTKIVAEIVRDLSDSLFLPFNLIEYAATLKTYAIAAHKHYEGFLASHKNNFDMTELQQAVDRFTHAAVNFHRRHDRIDLRDPMAIRMINDQLLLLERTFMLNAEVFGEPYQRTHAVSRPQKFMPRFEMTFFGLLDVMVSAIDVSTQDDEIQRKLSSEVEAIVDVLNAATESLREVHRF